MKTKHFILTALVSLMIAGAGAARGATNEVSALLQKGLFEEEANHNLEAAIQAYQAVVTQTEKDRQFAATAIFRLGECYRKLGRTNEANVQYQRIVKEFSDQTELAKLSQSYVGDAVSPAAVLTVAGMGVLTQPANDPEQDELKRIQAMIKDSPDLINGQSGRNIPLIEAAAQNYLTVAKYLLDNKADVNIRRTSDGRSAINQAAELGYREMVELLADHGADVNETEPNFTDRLPALALAAMRGYKAVAEVLLAHKADVNIKTRTGATPLHLTAQNGFMSLAELLLANGANVNARSENGETPMHFAARADNRAIIELLLAHKAEVDAKSRDGTTPLIAAVEASRLNAARVLVANKAEVNDRITGRPNYRFGGSVQSLEGWMPLHCAVAAGQPEMVKLLLENKAEPNAKIPHFSFRFEDGSEVGREDMSPLAMTAVNNRKEIAELLLEHKAEVNAPNKKLDTPLSLAVELKHQDMAELLLAHGATVQSLNNDHWSPLSLAVYDRSVDMVKLLLAHKPGLEVTDTDDFTPLQRAVEIHDDKITTLLLNAGAFVDPGYNIKNYSGLSPLGLAVLQRNKEMVELLLAHHANPNFQDNSGSTPLWFAKQALASNAHDSAASRVCNDIIDLLQKAGANENVQRLTRISVSRNNSITGDANFYKGTNSFNHFTLFDLLANHYASPSWRPNNPGMLMQLTQLPGLPFPDFGKIKINRLEKDGRTNSISVDLDGAFNSGDCSKDVPLQWGDIVEIPESDHNVNETWQGLADPVKEMLRKCLETKVGIVIKGRTNQVTLRPFFYAYGVMTSFPRTIGQMPGNSFPSFPPGGRQPAQQPQPQTELVSFWLNDVVQGANVIVTSSDLSRVKVRRVDPVSRKPVEMIFNLEKDDSQNRLWLRDGDVIEVPEKM